MVPTTEHTVAIGFCTYVSTLTYCLILKLYKLYVVPSSLLQVIVNWACEGGSIIWRAALKWSNCPKPKDFRKNMKNTLESRLINTWRCLRVNLTHFWYHYYGNLAVTLWWYYKNVYVSSWNIYHCVHFTNKKLEFDSGQNEFVLTFTDPKITLLFSLYPLLKLGRPVSCKGYPNQDIYHSTIVCTQLYR